LGDATWIRLAPIFITNNLWGDVAFVLSIPVAWICVWLSQQVAGLGDSQIIPGITVVVLVAALLHGMGLRWVSDVYGDDQEGRLGAAWLLWIYGLILAFALLRAGKVIKAASALLCIRPQRAHGAMPLPALHHLTRASRRQTGSFRSRQDLALRTWVDAGDLGAFQAEAGHQAGGAERDGINIPGRGPRRGPA
jgi:hypothetical protein